MKTQVSFNELFRHSKGRLKVIDALHNKRSSEQTNNWQDKATPLKICEKMVGLVPEKDLTWVVLFSLEFLEILVDECNILAENIIFVADCTQEVKAADQMYGVKSVLFTKEMFANDGNLTNFTVSVRQGLSNMKFNKLAVIGNPPYQMMDGGGAGKSSARPLYNLFVEACIDHLNPDYLTMIIPSRWMVGGKGLDSFREKMMSDRSIKIIVDDMNPSGVFPTVEIAGGVCYFLRDKTHTGNCNFNGHIRNLNQFDIVIRDSISQSIAEKVTKKSSKFIADLASPRNPYGFDGEAKSAGIPCYFKQSIGKQFADPTIIKNKGNDINTWRILVPFAPIAGQTDLTKQISIFNKNNVIICEPGTICSETYLILNKFKTKKEAQNFYSYLQTMFFRFMLKIRIISQNVTRESYRFVPDLQDYSKPWTDPELYKMFGLTKEEIDYIESKIKEFK